MKRFWAAANWKMNKSPSEAADFLKQFPAPSKFSNIEVVFYPQNFSCGVFSQNEKQTWGAQNCHFESSGAFTGENSPTVLKSMGAKTVLIGHSERRSLFFETDDIFAKKVLAAQKSNLVPLLCVGETLQERENQKTIEVIEKQLKAGLFLSSGEFALAYEPVWAIGTGKVATPEMAEEVHAFIRGWLNQNGHPASKIAVLYGGSVKPENTLELSKMPNIDGFLVGGASLDAHSFSKICETLNQTASSKSL